MSEANGVVSLLISKRGQLHRFLDNFEADRKCSEAEISRLNEQITELDHAIEVLEMSSVAASAGNDRSWDDLEDRGYRIEVCENHTTGDTCHFPNCSCQRIAGAFGDPTPFGIFP